MIGRIKILESNKPEILRPKLSADDVQLHFSGLDDHRLTINDKKKFIVTISHTTIEANSLLIIASVSKEGDKVDFFDFADVEFRFYPKI
tara:strand:+ start:259 stop:525 length:267 start_codon:yes stop_codon:yes gene_type:complete